MNDKEEEIDITKKLSYIKIVYQQTLYTVKLLTIKQVYTCIVYYILCNTNALCAVGWACIRNKYYFYPKQNMIFLN